MSDEKDSWESGDSSSDEDSDSDMENEKDNKKKDKDLNPKSNNVFRSKKMIEQEKKK